jgi:hypothetical protein
MWEKAPKDREQISEFSSIPFHLKVGLQAGCWWLTPIIPATQEAGIKRMEVRSQPRENSSRPYLKKYPSQK